jgi:hypothetical protein
MDSIEAGHNDGAYLFDDQERPARLLCKRKQHTRGDRVHAGGDGEEPAIQLGTNILIGLQQHPERRRHQHYRYDEEKAGECGNHARDVDLPANRLIPGSSGVPRNGTRSDAMWDGQPEPDAAVLLDLLEPRSTFWYRSRPPRSGR